ncbi:hypothetical protein [Metabacillus litoralis]|uniref:hypothetical protein n=1 Tax=Metabacillus litoralis TaxID=152268 RepID=UPI00203BB571|nr:hypothetical protein [Metabacillus litoralis]MCM3651331.1 hypothetical protein [Metabacillus litoralis]
MADEIKIPFGLADITIGEGADIVKFDGLEFFQADGGELTLTPVFQDITIADFGESVYDKILTGYNGTFTFVAAQDDLKILQLALSASEPIIETAGSTTVGMMDAKIGTSLRSKAKKVTIHPRTMGADKSLDIVIYKMASDGDLTKSFANAQGNQSVSMSMLPRDGMDVSKPGNFFYIGATDPNVAA